MRASFASVEMQLNAISETKCWLQSTGLDQPFNNCYGAIENKVKTTHRIEIGSLNLLPGHLSLADLAGIFVNVDEGGRGILGHLDLFNLVPHLGPLDGLLGEEGSAGGLGGLDGIGLVDCAGGGVEGRCNEAAVATSTNEGTGRA